MKRNFDPDEESDFNIPFPGVPDDPDAGMYDGFLVMESDEVAELFKPIINSIIALVEGQIDSLRASGCEVNGLILVGGFGQSEYLLKRLKQRFSTSNASSITAPTARARNKKTTPLGIEVLQPVNAWTAVVRGAVLRGLEGVEMVTNRKARRHYGISMRTTYDPARHSSLAKTWCERQERFVADGDMRWYIQKGQTVSSTEPVVFPFHRIFEIDAEKTVTEDLTISDADIAPIFSNTSATRTGCTMSVDLSTVPKHLWVFFRNSHGKAYYRLSFELGMQIESAGLRFDYRVDGKIYGKVTATFL